MRLLNISRNSMASTMSSSSTAGASTPARGSVLGWQQNSESFGGMGRLLFENHHLSDVVLHCGSGAAAQIKAHKLILASKSPVFEQMFFGDHKSADSMHICHVDLDMAILEVLIKLIYGFDHTPLLTTQNIGHVFRAAEKYKVHVAMTQCESWIGANMNATNCLFWLEAAQQFPVHCLEQGTSSNVTAEKCWTYIDNSTVEILRSPKFVEITNSLLVEILKRNSLHVDEYSLYTAVMRWAERWGTSSKRAVLDRALFQIRFTLMSAKEFGEGPAQGGILLPQEVSSILLYMVTDKKPPISFVTVPRAVVASGTFQVERFPATYGKREFVYDGDVVDSVSFIVDRDITLIGCGMYTCGKEDHDVEIEVFTGANKVLHCQESGPIDARQSAKFLTGPTCISPYMFNKQLLIPRSTQCTIRCAINGKDTDYGINGKEEASAKVILDNGNSVLYRFTFLPGPAHEQHSIRSLTSSGQIPTILFRS